MVPVNPYLCKPSKKTVASQPASLSSSEAKKTPSMATVTKPKAPRSVAPVAPPKPRPLPPNPPPTAPLAARNPLKPPPVVFSSSKRPAKSFKSKLKQEIQSLKRAKELEKQRKIQEKQEKQRQEQFAEQQKHARIQLEQIEKERQEAFQNLQEQERLAGQEQQHQWMTVQPQMPSYGPPMVYGQAPLNAYVLTGYPGHMEMPTNYVTPAKSVGSIGNAPSTPLPVPSRSMPVAAFSTQVTPNVPMNPVSVNPGISPLAAPTASLSSVNGSAPTLAGITSAVASASSTKPTRNPAEETKLVENVLMQSENVASKVNQVAGVKSEAMRVAETIKIEVPSSSSVCARSPLEAISSTAIAKSEPASDMKSEPSLHPNSSIKIEQHGVNVNGVVSHANAHLHLYAPPQYTIPYFATPQMMPMYPQMMTMPPMYPFNGWSPLQQQAMTMGLPSWIPPLAAQPKRTPPTISSKPSMLHRNPLHHVSPYAETHEAITEEVVIFKKPGKSFGVSFSYESKSVLADPENFNKMNDTSLEIVSSVKKQTSTSEAVVSDTFDKNLVSSTLDKERETTADTKPTSTSINASVAKTDSSATAMSTDVPTEVDKAPVKQRQRRRRRVCFGVVKVVTAEKQNANFSKESSKQLRPGDIVLKICGHDLGGRTFQQAIDLFAVCDAPKDGNDAASDSNALLIRCPLVVARMKPKTTFDWRPAFPTGAAPTTSHPGLSLPQKIPFVVNTTTNQVLSGEFSDTELLALAQSALRCVFAETRPLGHDVPADLEMKCLQVPALGQRDISSIKSKQNHAIRSIERSMEEAAKARWARQWKLEDDKMGESELQIDNLSDAQRSAMRGLPRPTRGCRCGSMSHEYVSDSKCSLYRNLRTLSEERPITAPEERRVQGKSKMSNLNAVETAFMDRMLRLKELTEQEEEEARFVQEMEVLQVKQLKMAVFVPSLTTMVLSAVAESGKDVPKDDVVVEDSFKVNTADSMDKESALSTASQTESAPTSKESMDADVCSDDDDDDLPLMALCKRDGPSPQEPEPKRLKFQSTPITASTGLDLSFFAKILIHISRTWGHLYTEPSDAEYSWRWEVYHGQTFSGESHRESESRNPRRVQSRSFENIQFALSDEVVARLFSAGKQDGSQSSEASLGASSDILLMSHLLSPKRTGVYDEIMALRKMGVLGRTRSGCVVLHKDWVSRVDPLLLDDMDQHWGKRIDPMNKHCVSKSIRDELEKSWSRVDGGWAMSADLEDVIFRDDEWDEWRRHFHDRFVSQVNEDEGIEKFGI